MERIKQWKKQLIGALLVLSLSVPLVLTAIADLPDRPTLDFRISGLEMREDGSAQLLFDVSILSAEKYMSEQEILSNGARFELNYNSAYMTPSNYGTNEALRRDEQGAEPNSEAAFQYNPELYQVYVDDGKGGRVREPRNPFISNSSEEKTVNYIDTTESILYLHLVTNSNLEVSDNTVGLEIAMTSEESTQVGYRVFNRVGEILLGTLSFRIEPKDLDKLPEMIEKYGGIKESTDPKAADGSYLLWFSRKPTSGQNSGPWAIEICMKPKGAKLFTHAYVDNLVASRGQAWFTFAFPRTPIHVEAAEGCRSELTVNAYQAYTNGRVNDLYITLQKYSPTVIVTYSDGSTGSFMLPWENGRGAPWTKGKVYDRKSPITFDEVTDAVTAGSVVVDGTPGAGEVAYDPTGGVYQLEKFFWYEETSAGGATVWKKFPIPVWVRMTVTPITLVSVDADDLHRSYILNDTLVSRDDPTAIQTVSSLGLPGEARLITDVPAGGATLSMPIPGWSHEQPGDGDTGYWPKTGTGTSTGGGEEMRTLWKDGATKPADNLASSAAYNHWPTADDGDGGSNTKWSQQEVNGVLQGRNRAGMYTFKMAETYGGAPTAFQKADIRAAYPWLTVPEDQYPLKDATRQLVWNGDPGNPPTEPKPPLKLEDISKYQVEYISTVTDTNSQPALTLQVTKVVNGVVDNMNAGSVFRVRLPDGTEMGVGAVNGNYLTGTGGAPIDWFDNTNGYHHRDERTDLGGNNDRRGYDLVSNPGDPTTPLNSYNSERERLRRYINLGGWFSVAIKEGNDDNGTQYVWSDFIPVYVPPRDNLYTESKEYNFIGPNAGQYPWPGGLGRTVYLPAGYYEPVDAAGEPILVDGARKVERYGVSTTYDGATGAQPGELNTFTIYPETGGNTNAVGWHYATSTLNGKQVKTYGANEFLHDALYTSFGRVKNNVAAQPAAAGVNETATIRTQVDTPATANERITLRCVSTSPSGYSTTYTNKANGNVNEVIYDTQMEGYTIRQDYTPVITNEGDTDIYGLDIDTLTDGDPRADGGGGHFVVLKPPASFLPAHTSTTFVLTYVYNLTTNNQNNLEYRDKLYITSNSRNDPGPDKTEGVDYLLDFYAQFQVTRENIHHVTVVVDPADETMGTAEVVVGVTLNPVGPVYEMNTNGRSSAFAQGNRVYIGVRPTDEYREIKVTAVDGSGRTFSPQLYGGNGTGNTDQDAKVPDGVVVYWFDMPDYDVTVTVKFYEPVTSKLRLSALTTYADETDNGLKPVKSDQVEWKNEYKVWRKSYTAAELAAVDAALGAGATDEQKNLYKMTIGKAEAKEFKDTQDQYIVVIPWEADRTQVEVTLRQVVYSLNGENKDLKNVTVEMNLYHTMAAAQTNSGYEPVLTIDNTNGDTSVPTTHLTHYRLNNVGAEQYAFDSPDPGYSKYVHIIISGHEDVVGAATEYRHYYLEIHRAPREAIADLGYGNSPYGMIMNDTAIAAGDKQAAKDSFRNNKYSFNGLTLVPAVVKGTQLEKLHYWTEAWVAPDAAYEPESQMGYLYNSADGTWSPDPAIYTAANNLDLNDYSFFAILGLPFDDPGLKSAKDSSGRPVDLTKVTLSLEAYTLDTSANIPQAERFALPDDRTLWPDRTVKLELGAATTPTSVKTVPAAWGDPANPDGLNGRYLRPGRYKLTYTFPDYDQSQTYSVPLTVTRDFVVLAPVGDVNADLTITHRSGDERLMKGRVTDPLGYTAANYEWAGIFKHRTCDVNNDRNINNIDANNIQIEVAGSGNQVNRGVKQYYLPTGYK